jgi:hypothetical protein
VTPVHFQYGSPGDNPEASLYIKPHGKLGRNPGNEVSAVAGAFDFFGQILWSA